MTVADEVERVRDRIASAGGDPAAVTIVAVTKGQPLAAHRAALAAGIVDLGESYAQELEPKADELDDPRVRWHFIGQVQRNKVRQIAHVVHLWHAVDRLTLGAEIARRAPGARVLAQVNLTDDPSRGGAKPDFVPGLVAGLRDLGLAVEGLMAVGPQGSPDAAAEGFRRVAALADRLELKERSMGMTADLEVAVAAGATMVRVGTALFGERPRLAVPVVEN